METIMPPLVADKLNDDGVLRLCVMLLKQYNKEYKLAIRSKNKNKIERLQRELDSGFMMSILDVMKITKQEVISQLEGGKNGRY